jgi:hypothetical protein
MTLSTGLDYSSGAYGKSETTEVSTVYLAAKYDTERWMGALYVPFLRVSGPASVVGLGPDAIVLPGTSGGRRRAQGLGDIVASATYKTVTDPGAPLLLDLGAKIKFGTADEGEGLGTGKNDYSVQADVVKPVGPVSAFAMLGYRWYGDPPGLELRNAFFGSVGAAWRDGSGTTLGASYDFRQPTVDGGARVSEVILFFAHPLGPQWRAQLYFIRGFTDASPDAGVGAVLSYRF